MQPLNLTLTVEVLPGESIDRACAELVELANRVGCCVEMQFNGVIVIAKPGADPERMVSMCHDTLNGESRHKVVVGHPVEREIAREEA